MTSEVVFFLMLGLWVVLFAVVLVDGVRVYRRVAAIERYIDAEESDRIRAGLQTRHDRLKALHASGANSGLVISCRVEDLERRVKRLEAQCSLQVGT